MDSTSVNENHMQPKRSLPYWYPRWGGRPIFRGNPDALGFILGSLAQAVVLMGVAAFLFPAVIELAKLEAGCEIEVSFGETRVPDCENTVYLGMKPSSLITALNSLLGVVSIILIPPTGAVVDHTRYRRMAGCIASAGFVGFLLTQIFLSSKTWFPLFFALVLCLFFGWTNTMLYHAYLPEITDDKNFLNQFSKICTVSVFAAIILYICSVLVVAMGLGIDDDAVKVAQLGMAVAAIFAGLLLSIAWGKLLGPRPAIHELPPNTSLLTVGFHQIYRTFRTLLREPQYRAVKWLFVGVAFAEAALKALGVVVVTLLIDQLDFTSTETGMAALVMLVSSIPGGIVGTISLRWINAKQNVVVTLCLFMTVNAIAAYLLKGLEQNIEAYLCVAGWGFFTGWKCTSDRIVLASVIPEGQDAELMGFYIFAGNILVWLPSTAFTILNEAGMSQRLSLFLINVPLGVTVLCYFKMGSYEDAISVGSRLRGEMDDMTKSTSDEDHTVPETMHSISIPTARSDEDVRGDVTEMDGVTEIEC